MPRVAWVLVLGFVLSGAAHADSGWETSNKAVDNGVAVSCGEYTCRLDSASSNDRVCVVSIRIKGKKEGPTEFSETVRVPDGDKVFVDYRKHDRDHYKYLKWKVMVRLRCAGD